MKKIVLIPLFIAVLLLGACSEPESTPSPAPSPTVFVPTPTPTGTIDLVPSTPTP